MPPKKRVTHTPRSKGTIQGTSRCKSPDRTAAAPVTPGPRRTAADATNKDTPHGSDKKRARERYSSKHSRPVSNAKQYAQRTLALDSSDSFESVATPVAQRPRTEPILPGAEPATSVVPDATGLAAAASRLADITRRTDELAETLEAMSVEPAQTRNSAPREALRAQAMRTVELEIETAWRRAREQRELLLAVLESPTLAFRLEVLYLQLAMAQSATRYPLISHTGREWPRVREPRRFLGCEASMSSTRFARCCARTRTSADVWRRLWSTTSKSSSAPSLALGAWRRGRSK
jgi:hypothetical protein